MGHLDILQNILIALTTYWASFFTCSVPPLTVAQLPSFFQCDQIGRFMAIWAIFRSLWQQLFCLNRPHFRQFLESCQKILVKLFLGNFYSYLSTFHGLHCFFLCISPSHKVFLTSTHKYTKSYFYFCTLSVTDTCPSSVDFIFSFSFKFSLSSFVIFKHEICF